MGLQSDLGYEHVKPGALASGLQRLFASRPMGTVSAAVLHRVDRPVFRLTDGRHTMTSLFSGLPVVMLTTTGRRSGTARTVPLIAVPATAGDLAVLGTNYGQDQHPAWVLNLRADPLAAVSYRGRSVDVTARRADARETDELFERSAAVYPGYAHYRERAGGRVIEAFVLEPRV